MVGDGGRPVRRRTRRHRGRLADLTEVRHTGGYAVRGRGYAEGRSTGPPHRRRSWRGGAINYAFIEHFQDVARGHFTLHRLERIYGKEGIRTEYDLIAAEL
jgi:hypothetical protein